MSNRVVAGVVVGLAGLGALGAAFAAAEMPAPSAAPQVVRGRVLVQSPVAGWTAGRNVTVEVRSRGALVSTSHVSSERFTLHVPPGSYSFSVWGATYAGGSEHVVKMDCWVNTRRRTNSILVGPGKEAAATLRCPLPAGSAAGSPARPA